MKKSLLFYALLLVSFALSGQNANSLENYIVDRFVDASGKEVVKIVVPGIPPDHREPVAIPSRSSSSLSNVPAYDWSFGCSATSAAMMAGYYDRTTYPNMYTGPTSGGVAPMDNSSWGTVVINGETRSQCPISATRNTLDGRTTRGHVDDYWIQYGNTGPDPFIVNGWTEHTYGDCTGDYMKTNQYNYGNSDGSTTFYNYLDGSPYSGPGNINDDGMWGLKLFFQSRGYTVTSAFNQYIYGYGGNTLGFTFAQYKAQINAGRPVLIQVEGHTMLGMGYDDTGNTVYLHDTWDYSTHTMTWGGYYSGMLQYAVGVVQLQAITDPCATIFTIGGCGSGYAQTYTGGGTGVWFNTSNNPCGYPTPGIEQIYSFVAPTTGTYSIQVTAASGYVDYLWKTSSCSSSGWTCIDDINTTGQFGAMSWTAGTTYYILLDDENSTAGTHTFYINCPVQTITVTSPNGGENWLAGSTYNITWTDNISENVIIQLFKNNVWNKTITSSTPSNGTYSWTIAAGQTLGTDYKIKIISTVNSAIWDKSDNNFSIISNYITVSSPNGGESWAAGSTHSVTWADNIAENVKIELYKAGVLNSTIIASTPSSGSYSWPIPSGQAAGTDYKVKITGISGSPSDFSDNNFTITAAPTYTITVTSPNGGEYWLPGSTHNITWTDNISENVIIQLFKNNVWNKTITSSTPSNGTYSWTIAAGQAVGSDYKIKIISTVNTAIWDKSDNNFTINSSYITVTSPNGGESWVRGSTHNITWTDNISENVMIQLFKNNVWNLTITSSTPSDGTHPWTIPSGQAAGTDYKIKIISTLNTSIYDKSDNNFSITASKSPAIVGTEELNGNSDISGKTDDILNQAVPVDEFNCLIYPNPSDGIVNLKVETSYPEDVYIRISDMTGKVVLYKNTGNKFPFQFDLQDQYRGIYLVQVIQGNNYKSFKLIRQ
jgi:hypothetical protein